MVCMNEQAALSDGGTAFPTRVSIPDRGLTEREPVGSPPPRGALALVGAWGVVADEEVDALVADIYTRRAAGSSRRVELVD